MLVIRDAQLQVFGKEARDRFVMDLTEYLTRQYPRECRQAGGPSQVGEFVKLGIAAAEDQGFSTRRQVRLFVSLMLMLGADFPRDIQLPWAAEALDASSISDPTLRIDSLFQEAVAYLESIAGKDGQKMVRALVRIRDFDLANVPDLSTVPEGLGETRAKELCGIWERFHPEKFARQGEAVTLALIRDGIRRADRYGMRDRIGIYAFTTLLFMLGTGYDRDPMHPWALKVLKDPAIPSGPERGKRLYAAAMAHLEQSLASG